MPQPDGRGRWKRTPKSYPLPVQLRIDDAATFEQFGYSATTISPGSLQSVVTSCSRCAAMFPRKRRRILAPVLCASCAHTKNGTIAPVHRSVAQEKVEIRCDTCGAHFLRRRLTLHKPPRCRSCHRVAWWKANSTPPTQDVTRVLDDAATQAKYGYLASAIRPKSFCRVVGTCTECSRKFDRIRRDVTNNTRCIPCSFKDRHTAESIEKQAQTMLQRYGRLGLPVPNSAYGTEEQKLADLLQEWSNEIPLRQRRITTRKTLDIYLPGRQLAVEYCGLHWHHEFSPTPRLRTYHAEKYDLCAAEGSRLITIFEDEWKTRRVACESLLRAALGSFDTRIGGRQCLVEEVLPSVAAKFMAEVHLQGASRRAIYAVGLFHEKKLIGAATLAHHHRKTLRNILVLDRLAFLPGVQALGGASKLIRHLAAHAKTLGAETLVTWSDNRWSNGNVYAIAGFTLTARLRPDYTYVRISAPRRRISKQTQQKHRTNCPPELTEHAWAVQRGYARVWDCGHRRWEMSLL